MASKNLKNKDLNGTIVDKTIKKAEDYIKNLQSKEGTWPVPYHGIAFLTPIYILGAAVANIPLTANQKKKFSNTILSVQIKDGSFGLHEWSIKGNVFSSVIAYVALRLMGNSPKDSKLKKCLNWIHQHGGPRFGNNWCKFILSFMNLYDYRGVSPIPPELYLLPSWFSFHPRKIAGWVRVIYLPMSYLYRTRSKMKANELTHELRKELYPNEDFSKIDFKKNLFTISPTDALNKQTGIFNLSVRVTKFAEKFIPGFVITKALKLVYEHVLYEDENSFFFRQAPVNAVYNTLVHFFQNNQEAFNKSTETLPHYLWETKDKIYVQGHTNTFSWDNGFYLWALSDRINDPVMSETVKQGRKWMMDNQITNELKNVDKFHRVQQYGSWPFADSQGWGVADCTANGIRSLLLSDPPNKPKEQVSDEAVSRGIKFLLMMQNDDGGWGTIDRKIGKEFLEWFNAANSFFDIMVDRSFNECTASVIQSLMIIKKYRPHLITPEIESAVKKGIKFLLKHQENDGSWYAFWGLCYIYGTYFAVEGLTKCGYTPDHPIIQKACQFILSIQHSDGTWGESPDTWLYKKYTPSDEGILISTSMAIMTLIMGGHGGHPVVKKAVYWIIKKQLKNGDWEDQVPVGGFYRTVLVQYPNYKRYFNLMALKSYRDFLNKNQ